MTEDVALADFGGKTSSCQILCKPLKTRSNDTLLGFLFYPIDISGQGLYS